MHNWRYKINAKTNTPKTNSNKQYDHGVRTFRPTSPLPTPGEKSTITTGFSTLTRTTFTPHSVGFQRSQINVTHHNRFSSSPKTSQHTLGFLTHQKPYNTHNVTNINLFSTIDENSIKHNSMLQSLTTLIYYVCKYNKLLWVCVTMRLKSNLNSI